MPEVEPIPVELPERPLIPNRVENPPPEPQAKKTKIIQFIGGFIGFFVLNGIGSLITYGLTSYLGNIESLSSLAGIFPTISGFVFLILNPALCIGLSIPKKTRWVGIGFLSGLVASFVIVIIAGIFLTIFCFYALSTS